MSRVPVSRSGSIMACGDRCDSGIPLPRGGLQDGVYAYAVAPCGFVVRAPLWPYLRGESRELLDARDTHTRDAHPRAWAEIQHTARMSAD